MHVLYKQTNAIYIHVHIHIVWGCPTAYNVHIHVQYLHTKPTIGTLVHPNMLIYKLQIEAG